MSHVRLYGFVEELLLASRRGAICVHGRVPYTSRAFAFLGRGAQAYDVSARTRVSSVHPVERSPASPSALETSSVELEVSTAAQYGGGRLMLTGKCRGLYILHHGKLTAVGGRFLYARHLENVVFDLGGLPLRP